jgi:multidrug transporter EmrE-like cation transporter
MYLTLIAAAISAMGQILLKHAMIRHGLIEFSPMGLIRLLSEPRLIVALGLYALALLAWLHVLSKVPLSTAYPMLAVTYVIVPVLSLIFFNERIHQAQVIGICFILLGVALIGKAA